MNASYSLRHLYLWVMVRGNGADINAVAPIWLDSLIFLERSYMSYITATLKVVLVFE